MQANVENDNDPETQQTKRGTMRGLLRYTYTYCPVVAIRSETIVITTTPHIPTTVNESYYENICCLANTPNSLACNLYQTN